MYEQFVKNLTDTHYASKQQIAKELWHVEGVLKNRLNQSFKFDLRPIKNNIKVGSFKTKADKIVFDIKDKWVIVDVQELHDYLKNNQIKDVKLQELVDKLDWNIVLNKV